MPGFDSGWVAIEKGELKTIVHGLGTLDVLIYVVGGDGNSLHHRGYGMDLYDIGTFKYTGLQWTFSTHSVMVYRGTDDSGWQQFRMLAWKIPSS